MRALAFTTLATLLATTLVAAQEGAVIPTTAAGATPSTYSCDPNTCKLASNCLCASKNPPNGIAPKDAPQFVVVTFDDSIQEPLMKTALQMLSTTNPNGCPARGTWYVSMEYTDFSLVQRWSASGHEVADHTFSHVGTPSSEEIASARAMLYEYAGLGKDKVQGFRAPFLNYTMDTLRQLAQQGFAYDSSASAVAQDAYWPYTLDNGMANDCWTGICAAGQAKIPGLWEFPMYAVPNNASIPQLMDVYMAGTPDDTFQWSMNAFRTHYDGGRQPFGIYVHPTHLTTGTPDPKPLLDGVIKTIKTIAQNPDVWFVTNQQLLQWMKNPVKASELGQQDYMKCRQPILEKDICNGLDDDQNGSVDDTLLNSCNVGTFNFKTCFNCPASAPSVSSPTPPSATQNGTSGFRYPVPNTCDPTWWDPVANACLCSGNDCRYKDLAVAVHPSGSNASQASSYSPHLPLSLALLGSFFGLFFL